MKTTFNYFKFFLLLVPIILFKISSAQINQGLVFYLPCNGNLRDSSIYNRQAPVYIDSSFYPVSDRWGNANSAMRKNIDFSDLGYSDTMMTNDIFTISMWAYVDFINSNGNGVIISIGDDPGTFITTYIGIDGSNGYNFFTYTTSPTNPKYYNIDENPLHLNVGKWVHLVAMRDTSMMKLYVNDTLVGSQSYGSSSKHLKWNPSYIHCQIFRNGTQNITGNFDEVRVYNRLLADSEIVALYNFAKPADALSLNKDTLTITAIGKIDSVSVISNRSWIVSSNQTWATVNNSSGTGNGYVKISVAQNIGFARNATITITAGALVKTFYIKQAGTTDSLKLNTDSLKFTYVANTDTIKVTSNRIWTASSNQTWATTTPSLGSGSINIKITVSQNTSLARNAIITITAGVVVKTVYISQSGFIDSLILNKDSLKLTYAASSDSIKVTSNRSWTVSSDQTWATINTSTGSGNGSFIINTAANTGTDRNATISVTAGTIVKTVYILQSHNTTGINEIKNSQDEIIVYPNPIINGKLILSIQNKNQNKNYSIKIFDISGKELLRLSEYISGNEIDVSSLPNGMYILTIQNGDKISRAKFVNANY